MCSTTLHQGQFHRFLFCYVLLCDLPPFIKVNSTASYSFVVYCYAMYCSVIYHPSSRSIPPLLILLLCIVMLCIVRSRTTLHHSQFHQVKVIRNSEVLLPNFLWLRPILAGWSSPIKRDMPHDAHVPGRHVTTKLWAPAWYLESMSAREDLSHSEGILGSSLRFKRKTSGSGHSGLLRESCEKSIFLVVNLFWIRHLSCDGTVGLAHERLHLCSFSLTQVVFQVYNGHLLLQQRLLRGGVRGSSWQSLVPLFLIWFVKRLGHGQAFKSFPGLNLLGEPLVHPTQIRLTLQPWDHHGLLPLPLPLPEFNLQIPDLHLGRTTATLRGWKSGLDLRVGCLSGCPVGVHKMLSTSRYWRIKHRGWVTDCERTCTMDHGLLYNSIRIWSTVTWIRKLVQVGSCDLWLMWIPGPGVCKSRRWDSALQC